MNNQITIQAIAIQLKNGKYHNGCVAMLLNDRNISDRYTGLTMDIDQHVADEAVYTMIDPGFRHVWALINVLFNQEPDATTRDQEQLMYLLDVVMRGRPEGEMFNGSWAIVSDENDSICFYPQDSESVSALVEDINWSKNEHAPLTLDYVEQNYCQSAVIP